MFFSFSLGFPFAYILPASDFNENNFHLKHRETSPKACGFLAILLNSDL